MNFAEWRRKGAFVRRARAAAHATPDLSAAYDRVQQAQPWPWRHRVFVRTALAMFVVPALIVPLGFFHALLVSGAYARVGPDGVLVVISFFQSCLGFAGGAGILGHLRRFPWMGPPATALLPVSDRQIAWRAWWSAERKMAFFIYPTVCGFGFVAFAEKVGPMGWSLALALGVAQWLVTVGLSTSLAVRWPTFPGSTIALYGIFGGMLWLTVYFACGAPGLPVVANILFWLTPAGWLSALFGRAYLQGMLWVWCALLPIALIIAAGAVSLFKLLRTYRIKEFQFVLGTPALADSNCWSARALSVDFDILPRALGALTGVTTADQAALSARPTAKEVALAGELIQNRFRSFAHADAAGGNLLDRLQHRFLTRREANILAYMTAESLRWNRVYPKVLAIHLASIALLWLFPIAVAVAGRMLLGDGKGALLPCVQMLAISCLYFRAGFWLGFSAPQFGGKCVARYALVPIGFDETSWLMFKIGIFRGLLVVPLLLSIIWTIHFGAQAGFFWLRWAQAGLLMAFLYVVGHGWMIAARFAGAASWPVAGHDRWSWQLARAAVSVPGNVLLIFVTTSVSGIAFGSLIGFGWLPDALAPYFVFVLIAPFGIGSLLAWFCMRAMYRRGIVDLVRVRPSIWQQWLLQAEQGWHVRRG